jgi:hypothetical protein
LRFATIHSWQREETTVVHYVGEYAHSINSVLGRQLLLELACFEVLRYVGKFPRGAVVCRAYYFEFEFSAARRQYILS